MTKPRRQTNGLLDRVSRRLVQLGFLLLFLFPLFTLIYRHLDILDSTSEYGSWLLPWDPLLALGNLINRRPSTLILGAALCLLAISLVFGRSFCGWVCPMGTITDLIRPLAFWQRKRKSTPSRIDGRRNRPWRYALLAATLGSAVLSIKLLGWVDPLIIFGRTATAAAAYLTSSQQAFERGGSTYFSVLFLCILVLEFLQPHFWCRHLCPQGALLGLVSRFSLLNRQVSTACNNCVLCKRACPMNAIPLDAHNTDYSDCTFCLECEPACPENGIRFGFGSLAMANWKPRPQNPLDRKTDRRLGGYEANPSIIPGGKFTRRQFLKGIGAMAAGLVFAPLTTLGRQSTPLRPPGALPEAEFLKACIACQECIRVCPTHGLQAAFLQSGLTNLGMPQLVPRLGACALGISCNHLCQQVCPEAAILPVNRKEFKIGLAQVDHGLCLAWDQGLKCLVCIEACQYQAAVPYRGRVTVDSNKCVGCGFCESGCPVPGSAIHVRPRAVSAI